ncbi:hypothetical protein, partial [Neoaquamicrobium microcysteis]|uniref:hypothetical protein n=1 Tax=Neoaquamicrobium microcysteis TaxID=2682781 RepID=UPI00191BDC9D
LRDDLFGLVLLLGHSNVLSIGQIAYFREDHFSGGRPIPDADERLGTALNMLYPYYRRTRQMMTNIHRDEDVMPLVKQMMGGYREYLETVRHILLHGRAIPTARKNIVKAAIGHALSFPAWRSLALEQGLTDEQCSELMCGIVWTAQSQQR